MTVAPLEDPAYEPKHPPVEGHVPEVVAKWGPRSQVRWFRRFRNQLKTYGDWGQYFIDTELHRGPCCFSCQEEYWEYSTGVIMDDYCCCKGARALREQEHR